MFKTFPANKVHNRPCRVFFASGDWTCSIAQFLGNQAMREPYDRLAEIVRSGRTVLPGDGSVTAHPIPMSPHTIVVGRA